MTRRALACALSIYTAAGCASMRTRPSAPTHDVALAKGVLEALALDDRGYSREGLARWEAIAAHAGRGDASLVLLAIEHIDAAIAEGVVDDASEATLVRMAALALPDVARPALALARAHRATLAGDDAAARSFEREAGCGLPWRSGGLVGRLPRVDLTRPPEVALARLTDTPLRGCRVSASTPDGRPGAIPLALDFSIDRQTTLELDVTSDAGYQLWADGAAGPRPDDRAPLRRRRAYRISMSPGAHRLVVTGAALYGRLEVGLALRAPPGVVLHASAPSSSPRPVVASAHADAQAIVEQTIMPARMGTGPGGVLDAYLDASDRQRDGDGTAARLAAERLLVLAPSSGPALALAARIAGSDGTVPSLFAHDRARRLLERALEADPQAARVRYELGHLAIDRDRPRDALELAEAAPDRHVLRAALLYADVLHARGRDEEVAAMLRQVSPSDERACSLADAQLADDRAAHRPLNLDRAERVARCRPGSTVLADALRQMLRSDEALAEYRRLLAADPGAESARLSLGDELMAAGHSAEAVPVYRWLSDGSPRSASYRLHLVEALRAQGRDTDAVRALEAGLALDPENAELAAAARSLALPDVGYDRDRIDGRAVIRAFEAEKHGYDGPAVFVLDRALLRVYPTGAQRMITHNIVKVLSKEGIDRWGEWKLPDGAEVLTLCAWKPDGSRLEPEEIAEKESVSLPGLAAGDYVEVEYVERQGAPAAFPHGFLGERFYFASLESPLDRSEYVLITPADMPVEIEARGTVPEAVVEQREEPRGKVAVRTLTVRAAPQRFAEPSAAPLAEYTPSVRPRSGVSREAWQLYLAEFGWGARRRDPAIGALAAKLTRGVRDDHERLIRLDAWVRANVQHGGGLDDAASAILARHEGNRVTLLAALAEAAGLRTRVLLARSQRSAAIETDLEGYNEALVEAAGVIIDPRYRRGRPGELRPELRGARALVLEPGSHEVVTLPPRSDDQRQMKVQITLDADGSGHVGVEETLRGWPALEWREGLSRLPRDRVRPQFEQHTLGYYFPGAVLHALDWDNEEALDRPFVVRYAFDAPSLVRRSGDALVLPVPFAAQLLRRYATGAPRQTPLYVDEVSPTTLALTVTLPSGVSVDLPPAVRQIEAGEFEQRATLEGSTLSLHGRFALPGQRVSLADWPRFLTWISAVDRAEAEAVRVEMPRPPSAPATP